MTHNRVHKALTLVEMAISLAIVSMLLAGVFAVIRSLGRTETAQTARHDVQALGANIRSLLTADLVHVSELSPIECGFNLKTHATLESPSMEIRHLPAEVEYRLEAIGSRNWLVRVQSPHDRRPQRELVCTGVSGFCIEAMDAADVTPAALGAASSFAVTVEFEGSSQSLFFVVRKD